MTDEEAVDTCDELSVVAPLPVSLPTVPPPPLALSCVDAWEEGVEEEGVEVV